MCIIIGFLSRIIIQKFRNLINKRTARSAALGVISIANQFGVRITQDSIEQMIDRQSLSSSKSFKNKFAELGITARFKKTSLNEIKNKSYFFPCVALLKDGSSRILISYKSYSDTPGVFLLIDPLDATGEVQTLDENSFIEQWSKNIVLVSKYSGVGAQDRIFDWKWFLPELLRHKWLIVITLLTSILTHILGLAPIIFIQISLDKVLGYGAVSTLHLLTAAIVLALIFNGILGFARDYVVNFISTTIEARLAGDLFDKTLALPTQTFQTSGSGELEGTLQSPAQVRVYLSRQILTNLFDATGILIFVPVLFGYSPYLALVVVAFGIISGLASLFGKWKEKSLNSELGSSDRDKQRTLRETITGIEAVKVFSLEDLQRKDWRRNASRTIHKLNDKTRVTNIVSNFSSTLQQLMTVAIVFVGVNLVLAGGLSAGAIIAANMLGGKAVGPIKQLITFFADLDGMKKVLEQISKVWNGQSERSQTGSQLAIKGNLNLRDVTINFGETNALNKLSLQIKERTKIAIVGASASGKTTLLRLIQGLLVPNSGLMEVDSYNLRSIDLNNYRGQVALVDPRPVFFTATIEENLRRIKPKVSERELEEAFKVSGFDSVLDSLPQGLSTEIDQLGSPLSQGDRISLAIARSLIERPKVLLFDEVFSNLDKMAQLKLLKNIDELSRNKTFILVTHDLRFITKFDNIFVLNEGSIVGSGNHNDLLINNKFYKNMWDIDSDLSQLNKDDNNTNV
ncbi:MAG: hypothetical protein CMM49_02210 [Rhodospirillaceae bacterium]|nr:hypothetical protein [Rhodospirillaceae bacterium]|tara:strand:- start:3900 stop:6122 length:2223 start_codon:yes stop_codon:yes gene_type:complete